VPLVLLGVLTWFHPSVPTPSTQVIEIGALIMQLAAAVTLGSTVVVWDYFSSREDLY